MTQKIGLFAGTFDPVHQGHVDFAETAVIRLGLQRLYVVPEKKPRGKSSVSSIDHRIAMLKLAFSGNDVVAIKTIQTDYARIPETLSELGLTGKVYLLLGTDVALTLKTWRHLTELYSRTHFVVGVRSESDAKRIDVLMAHLGLGIQDYTLIRTSSYDASSSRARKGSLQHLAKVDDYIQKHHLYEV